MNRFNRIVEIYSRGILEEGRSGLSSKRQSDADTERWVWVKNKTGYKLRNADFRKRAKALCGLN